MRYFLAFLVPALLLTTPACAQDKRLKGGLSYTTVGPEKAKEDQQKNLRHKTIEPASGDESAADAETGTPSDRVWKKYKALAAGEHEDNDTDDTETEDDESTEDDKTAQKEKTPSAPATGIAGILEQYQRNKEERSDMKSLVITDPEKPQNKEDENEKSD